MVRYLHFRFHYPAHVKRETVRCLRNHARCITQQGQNLEEEEDHFMKAFVRNGCPRSFICSASSARTTREDKGEREEQTPPTVHLSYIAGEDQEGV